MPGAEIDIIPRCEDMLARFCGGDDLPGVQSVRGGEHHGVDRRIGEHFFVAVMERKSVRVGEGPGFFRGARRAGGEADRIALSLHARDQVPAPSAEADDRRADHGSFSVHG